MDATPAPFTIDQKWVRISNNCWVGQETIRLVSMATSLNIFSLRKHGNRNMSFTGKRKWQGIAT
jgi:hypothetical protein